MGYRLDGQPFDPIGFDPHPFDEALEITSLFVPGWIAEQFKNQDGPVADAMRYALDGGKCLRAYLVYEGGRLHGIPHGKSLPAAKAIECIHAYSLIHDDLPCMDDDGIRRGKPTVHKKWDEATAVLAGDALQSLAFECLGQLKYPADHVMDLVVSLAKAAGIAGMVGGQAADIAAETAKAALTLEQITDLQARKTGALISWAAQAGPILAGDDPTALRQYAQALGLAFQIADDILDVEGDAATAGKRLQKDADAGKATFVSLLGLQGAKARALELVEQAEAALDPYGDNAAPLKEAARFVISRDK
ncbi:polyprenyl synthetase family protein [Parasulfitobacter algicola]|uniref:Polyprenyl synthetase family protein n=1 Tax=Parasulfitobacter algicola TaxID=2614809 RepID=A0ABX2J0J7_9RHOB|nr:farnesyl diphosphate synthase [Sulfitobacter algicola]NSX56676.1 polyprenyl synthetase family protein [Sulfitobacter algicola]